MIKFSKYIQEKTLNKPFLTPGGPKKRAVYVRNEKGNILVAISENNEICPLKPKAPKTLISEKKVNLYYYPSLNSPYTFVSAKRVREFH